MKMKTKIFYLVALFMCTMVMGVFTSCSKSDDKADTPSTPDTTPATAQVTYLAEVTKDMSDNMVITVDYYDANGNMQTETLSGLLTWTKTLTFKIPCKVAARLNFKAKDGVDYSTFDKLSVGGYVSHIAAMYNKAGVLLKDFNFTVSWNTMDVPGKNIEKYITEKGTGYKSFLYNYDEKGNKTEGSW